MSRKPTPKRTRPKPKAVLRLPDLDQAKSAVLNSLTSADAQRGYRDAIDEFVDWYCSEPRLSFNRAVVLRYRIHLESRRLAPCVSLCDFCLTAPPSGVLCCCAWSNLLARSIERHVESTGVPPQARYLPDQRDRYVAAAKGVGAPVR
jgi:hypothetical protein